MAIEVTFTPGTGTGITGHDFEVTPQGGTATIVNTTIGAGLTSSDSLTYVIESASDTVQNVVRVRSVSSDGPGEWSDPITVQPSNDNVSGTTLGRDADPPPFGAGIISATYSEEVETVDVSNRENVGGNAGLPGRKSARAGLVTRTWEIECHDPAQLISLLEASGSGFAVMGVSESIGIEGAVTYTVTAREL